MNRINRKGCQLWVIQGNYENFSKFSFNSKNSLKKISLEGIFKVCCLLKSTSMKILKQEVALTFYMLNYFFYIKKSRCILNQIRKVLLPWMDRNLRHSKRMKQ